MTEQEKQEIIAEVKASVMDEMKGEARGRQIKRVLKDQREKWYRGESPMCKAFPSTYMAWDAWEHIRRLTCLVCGESYVRQLEGNPDAERICDEICQKIYDLRMEVRKENA